MIFCTISDEERAAEAMAWGNSVKLLHPEARRVLCFVGGYSPIAASHFDEIVILSPTFCSTKETQMNASRPYFLQQVVKSSLPDEPVIYMDSDCCLYHRFDNLADYLELSPIVTISHRLDPEPRGKEHLESERLRNGFLHSGFVGIRKTNESERFLGWWTERTINSASLPHSADKWLSLAMSIFDIHVLRDPTYHLAFWNIDEQHRRLLTHNDGQYFLPNGPLRSFCFRNRQELSNIAQHDPVLQLILEDYELAQRTTSLQLGGRV